jgi:hypothetical protein
MSRHDICCFSAKHAALRSKSKDWLARNLDNVFQWSSISTVLLLFQWTSTIKNPTEQSRHHHHLIDCNLYTWWYSWNIAHLALNNNQSLTLLSIYRRLELATKKLWSQTLCKIYYKIYKYSIKVCVHNTLYIYKWYNHIFVYYIVINISLFNPL